MNNSGFTLVDVRAEAMDVIAKLKNKEIDLKTAQEVRNLLGTIVDCAKTQVEFLKAIPNSAKEKMKPEERIARLMPHEMTTKLFEEMANLRLKPTGNGMDINLEQINKRYTKDKFSSFEYGLWRIKEIEEEYYKKWRRKSKKRTLTFYTEGG